MEHKNIKPKNMCSMEIQPLTECVAKDICTVFVKLATRLKKLQPKRHQRQIRKLARPKNVVQKTVPTNTCESKFTKKTEIIQELPVFTRTEQLAYPCARRILPIREDFKNVLGEKRVSILDRVIKKSTFSLYSRLANYQPPKKNKHVRKWTSKEWADHRKYLSKLAKPKRNFQPTKKVHLWKDISIMNRYKYLCKPKERWEDVVPKWELTPALKYYEPTAIITRLARKKEFDETLLYQTVPRKITQQALNYKASERIAQLATRAEIRLGESDLKENPFVVSPNALKGKPSERVVELSQPKEYEEGHIRQNPFLISPAALKAKATPRIIELSKPKGS